MPSIARLRQLGSSLIQGVLLDRGGRRRVVLRKGFFDLAKSVTPSVAVQHDGTWYFVSTQDNIVGRNTFATGPYELEVMASVLSTLEQHGRSLRGRTFVDIGANIGVTTIQSLTRFGASDALAVEPEPRNFRLLRCNLVANELDHRVRTVRAAASMNSGTGQLARSRSNSGDHRIRLAECHDRSPFDGDTIEVPLRRLDDLLAEHLIDLDDIGAVWIDAQGHDAHVLGGAPNLMRSSVPVIAEYWPYGLRLADGLDLLHSLIETNFDLVIDVREVRKGEKPRPFRARDVKQLEGRYPAQTFTDLILLTATQ